MFMYIWFGFILISCTFGLVLLLGVGSRMKVLEVSIAVFFWMYYIIVKLNIKTKLKKMCSKKIALQKTDFGFRGTKMPFFVFFW